MPPVPSILRYDVSSTCSRRFGQNATHLPTSLFVILHQIGLPRHGGPCWSEAKPRNDGQICRTILLSKEDI